MQLILYNVTDSHNVIGKTMNEVTRVNITMKKTEDIEQPTIVLTDTGLTYNYAKIPFFNRYYFIDEFKRGTNGLITIVLSVDVLETYKNDILNADSNITHKNKLDYNENAYDVDSRKDVETYMAVDAATITDTKILVTVGG